MSSRWCDPPSDILPMIADHLDSNLGLLHLRSVCQSWRSSLPPPPPPSSTAISFPLHLPPPPPSTSTSPHLLLHHRTFYLLSPLHSPIAIPPSSGSTNLTASSSSNSLTDGNAYFLIKVEQTAKPNENADYRNTFSLFNPLFSRVKLPPPNSPINLLDYRVTRVCESFTALSDISAPSGNPNPIKKVVVARNFFAKGDFVVLALKYNGELLLWKFGDEQWTEIPASGRCFDDIICYNGKFYATANRNGMLVMIDSRLTPYCLVSKLMYGNGFCTSLVECNGCLYLLDCETGVKFGVFKLDDKHRFWDYEPDLDGCVLFLGDDANFALSRKDYSGCIRDVVFFKDVVGDGSGIGGFSQVFDVKSGDSCFVGDDESFAKFYWPPSSWFVGADTDCFR